MTPGRAPARRAAAAVLAAALCVPVGAATSAVTPEMDKAVRAGIDAVYSMDFAGAQAHFERLRALAPEAPFGDFGLTAVAWARFIYESEKGDDSLVKPFEAQVERTLAKSEAWLKTHPDDADVLLTKGAAEGIRGRLQAERRQYVRAFISARAAMKSVHAALAKDPKLYDAYLGLGMYDYYTDLYPRLIRALAKAILRGDRERGIKQLRLAAEKGRWMAVTAKMVLVEIYLHDPFGARDAATAGRYMEEILARYPKSAMLRSVELLALYQTGRLEEFLKGSSEFVRRCESGEYRKVDLPKAQVFLGTALFAAGRRDEAVEAYRRAAAEPPINRWGVWGLIRAGNVLDLLGRRDAALASYKRAAAEPDRWGYKALAEQGLHRPFKLPPEFTVDPP